jgi:hypothetical protein
MKLENADMCMHAVQMWAASKRGLEALPHHWHDHLDAAARPARADGAGLDGCEGSGSEGEGGRAEVALR